MGNIIRILHLSDIHLDENIWNLNQDENKSAEKKKEKAKKGEGKHDLPKFFEYKETFINFIKNIKPKPNFIIITGDLVNSGNDQVSYDILNEFLTDLSKDDLSTELFIKKENIIIVPGNHDVNWEQSIVMHRLDCFQDFLKRFYENQEYEIEIDSHNNKIIKKKWEYDFIVNNEKINFTPLYSPLLNPENLIPQKIREVIAKELVEDNTDNSIKKWFKAFDRGLIEKYQIDEIKEVMDDTVRVCIFHHNPLSISRPKNDFSTNFFPEINLLSNGAEVIEELTEKGFDIIFHGHRHQNSIIELKGKKIIIIGAPSLIKRDGYNDDQNIGFNIVDLNNNNGLLRIKINRYLNEQKISGGIKIKHDPDFDEFIIKKNNLDNSIITYQDGLNELSKQILDSKYGETILHYRPDANWNIEIGGIPFSPFEILLKNIIDTNKNDVFNDLIKSMNPGITNSQSITLSSAIKKEIRDIFESHSELKLHYENIKYLITHFKSIINRHYPTAESKNDFLEGNNTFTRYIKSSEKERENLYAFETFKCIINSDWQIHKSIYFPSLTILKTEHSELVEENDFNIKLKDIRQKKFQWLLESLIEVSLLPNYQITWLPYYIKGFSLKSIVAFNHGPLLHSILIGFQEDKINSSGAVLSIEKDKHGADGLLKDLKSLINKNIYPLVNFLTENFPILRNQTISLNNLKIIEKLFDLDESILNNFISQLRLIKAIKTEPSLDDYDNINIDYKKYIELLEKLFYWVLSPEDFSYGNKILSSHKDYWDKNEKIEYIDALKRLMKDDKVN